MEYNINDTVVDIPDEYIERHELAVHLKEIQEAYLTNGELADSDKRIHRDKVYRIFEDDYNYVAKLNGRENQAFLQRVKSQIFHGYVYGVEFPTQTVGSELRDYHRAVVITPGTNRQLDVVMVVPLSHASNRAAIIEHKRENLSPEEQRRDEELRTMIRAESNEPELCEGYVVVRQMRIISYARFALESNAPVCYGRLTNDCLREVLEGIDFYLGMNNFPRIEKLNEAKRRKTELHKAVVNALDNLQLSGNKHISEDAKKEYLEKAIAALEEVKDL